MRRGRGQEMRVREMRGLTVQEREDCARLLPFCGESLTPVL